MDRESATHEINRQTPDAFLQKAKKRGYICPECGNGSGKDGDGIVKNPSTGKYKCFKCGLSGDILDLIGAAYGLSEFNDQFQKATEIYGISVDRYNSTQASSPTVKKQTHETIQTVTEAPASSDLQEYFKKCHDNADKTDYFKSRGITQESIDRFNLGYDEAFNESTGKYPWKAVIIPTSAETFEARNTAVEPNSADKSGYKYRKHGNLHLFNSSALSEEKEKPIIICEGIFDAISLIQSGAQAVSIESAANYTHLLTELDRVKPSKPLIILFDDDQTGKDCTAKLEEGLKSRKISYMTAPKIIEGYHDPNDRLLKDADGLVKAVQTAYEEAALLPDPQDEAKNEYMKTSAAKSVSAFIDMIQQNMNRPKLSTGFPEIDKVLDGGIYTGFYIIGAISSLGKTTLTLQIADNLAKQGRDVLFFSLEQSKYDLMSKSISRETFLDCRSRSLSDNNAKSNLGVLDGHRWANFNDTEKEVMNHAFTAYRDFASHIFIHEGIGNISVAEIREKVMNHISITGNKRPIVFIDYLQILKAADGDERSTDKQIVDHNVTALKQLSRDFDIPIIAVSSLNRQNYSEKINMAAFKESGAIEYGSDVLIGLQLTGAGDKDFDVDKAKDENPRSIDCCILKNRNGRITTKGIPLTYYPVFNCFMDNDAGGWMTISKEDEDNIPFT